MKTFERFLRYSANGKGKPCQFRKTPNPTTTRDKQIQKTFERGNRNQQHPNTSLNTTEASEYPANKPKGKASAFKDKDRNQSPPSAAATARKPPQPGQLQPVTSRTTHPKNQPPSNPKNNNTKPNNNPIAAPTRFQPNRNIFTLSNIQNHHPPSHQ